MFTIGSDIPGSPLSSATLDVTFLQERLSGHVGRVRARPLHISRDRSTCRLLGDV